MKSLLERELPSSTAVTDVQPFDLVGKDQAKEGRHMEMEVDLSDSAILALTPPDLRANRNSRMSPPEGMDAKRTPRWRHV